MDMSIKRKSLKERFQRIFAKTDIPFKSDPGKTVKNVVYVSGSKTWKARAAAETGQNDGNNNRRNVAAPTFNFVVDPQSPESPRSEFSFTNGGGSGVGSGGGDAGRWDRRDSLDDNWLQNGQPATNGWTSGVSAQFVSGTHPDVEYFTQQPVQPAVGPPQKGKSKSNMFKDKNTYRHQYFLQKTQEQEEEERPVRPGKLDVDPTFKQHLLRSLGGETDPTSNPQETNSKQHSEHSVKRTATTHVPPPPPPPPPPAAIPSPPSPPPLPSPPSVNNIPPPAPVDTQPPELRERVYHNIASNGNVVTQGVQTGSDTLGPLPDLKLHQKNGHAIGTQMSPGSQYSHSSTIRDFMLSSPTGVYNSVLGTSTLNSLTFSATGE